ncbi:MAG: exo-alpha-sialidase [Ruminococcaceae bacterium]|nr:exo-alpha-sialidase [Oscillospiraceae bacterium]
MRKNNVFFRILSLVFVLSLIITSFSACSEEKPSEEEKDYLDISGYSIVRKDNSEARIVSDTASLKITILSVLGTELPVQTDWYNPNTPPDPNAKEILIDQTNRKESSDALAKLKDKSGDAYIIDITENKIVILGKTAISTARAIKHFINEYVLPSAEPSMLDLSAGKTVATDYTAVKYITAGDSLAVDVEVISTIFAVPENRYMDILGYFCSVDKAQYPSMVELKYQKNEEDNGKLVAIFGLSAAPVKGGPNTNASVWTSSDGGKSWTLIARPEETIDTSIEGISMAHIYELPAQVGDMPAGTLLYSGNSVNYARKSHIGVWRSFDCGYTWEEYTIVASAGGLGEGIWEPFMWYEESDGYLYCFYSDDSDPKHDQKLVYKRSKDGKTWSKITEVCAFKNPAARPGMFVMTKMGNGEYFAVYEYCGTNDCHIYYKTTKDITDWNPSDEGTLLEIPSGGKNIILGSAPSCVWTPAGGENGTLIVTGKWENNKDGKTHHLYVSFDYGKTWETMETPLPYDEYNDTRDTKRIGYSPCLVLGSDTSVVHYVNMTDVPENGMSRIQYAKLNIVD